MGFKDITIFNCVFDGSGGFALETVDGALIEEITFTGITMRDCTNTPIFLYLGARMRAPSEVPVGSFKRVIISNAVSYNSRSVFGGAGLIRAIPGHNIEDVKINEIYMEHVGGGTSEMAAVMPSEEIKHYPKPTMFGNLPASGFFVRHAKNFKFSNVKIAWSKPDARPVFWMQDVDGVDIFHLKLPKANTTPVFSLQNVQDFSVAMSRGAKDVHLENVDKKQW